jgi:MFS family permease
MGCAVATITTQLPLFAMTALNYSPIKAGSILSVVALSGIAGRLAWGFVTGSLRRDMILLFCMSVCAGVSVVGIGFNSVSTSVSVLFIEASLFGFFGASWISVGMIAVMEHIEMASVGRAAGRVMMGFYGGLVVGPLGFGYLLSQGFGNYLMCWSFIGSLCVLAAIVLFMSGQASGKAGKGVPR